MHQPGKHTILFIQKGNVNTRTYYDFPTVTQCMAFIIEMFDNELKRMNPQVAKLTYKVNDIYVYIDSFAEFNMLILDQQNGVYVPYGRSMIKDKILQHLNNITRQNFN